ncbi:MAG: DsbE family thiol:disulfide interchange protein [Pseudomonadota bacterium]
MNAIDTDRLSAVEAPLLQEWPSLPALSRRLMLVLPAAAFAGLAGAHVRGLTRNPSQLTSTLIEREDPEFILPSARGRRLGLSSDDLKGQMSLVNFFASWCAPCRLEHPFFLGFSRKGIIPLYGNNHKDTPENATHWLNTLGNPYAHTGACLDGRVGIDWGVYDIPETFVIGTDGRGAYRRICQLTQRAVDKTILPLVNRLQKDLGNPKS